MGAITENPRVAGSIPAMGTTDIKGLADRGWPLLFLSDADFDADKNQTHMTYPVSYQLSYLIK